MTEDKWEKLKRENTAFDGLIEEMEKDYPEEMEAARKWFRENRERILSEMTVVPIRWDDGKQVFVEDKEKWLIQK